ncbi:calcium/sodium antiporter [Patescibacteria group bacterium]
MFTNILLLIAGFILLIYGADYLVKGSSSFAKRLGVRSFVIGLTVVAFGTSAPELIVNLFSAGTGSEGLAIGNIFGSNISNTLLILGVTAFIAPVAVAKGTVWKEIPLSLLAAIVVVILGSDTLIDRVGPDVLTRIDGLVLIIFFVIFMYYSFGLTKAEGERGEHIALFSKWKTVFFIFGGIAGLFIGGKLIVDSAVVIALSFGISQHLVGLTIVAIGTSLPELATSVVAALKKNTDLAIGNVVGSNIFNIFFVLGITATAFPLPYSEKAFQDGLMLILVSAVLFIGMFIGRRDLLNREKGVVFLAPVGFFDVDFFVTFFAEVFVLGDFFGVFLVAIRKFTVLSISRSEKFIDYCIRQLVFARSLYRQRVLLGEF